MKKHYETHVEDTDKLISVAGPVLDYKSWYEQYRKLMEEQAQRKYGLYTPTSEGDDDFPSISGMIARYSALGLTNEQMAANPVWVDKTGNGHDIQLKNFSWKGMSGVGGYVQDFNYFRNNATVDKIRIDEQGSNSIKVTILTTGISNAIYIPKNIYQFNKSYFIKISSEGYDEGDMALSFYAPSTSTATTVTVSLNPNGVTEIPAIKEDDFLAVYINVSGKVGSFTVEQLPLYPGALVFDGVDDYGVCDNFPVLTKEKGYTVVALRQYLFNATDKIRSLVTNAPSSIASRSTLTFELINSKGKKINFSFEKGNLVSDFEPNVFSYMTSKSYNGKTITPGDVTESNERILVGNFSENVEYGSNVAIWELVFLDHDATEEELTKIKDYFVKTYPWLFPDQAWTVTGKTNEDDDRATIANITGNGNDLILSNFGFAEGSGYNEQGEYAGYLVTDGVDDKVENSPFTLNKDWTIVGNWTMLSNIPSNCGIIKVSSMFLYNSLDGVTIYFTGGPIKIQSKSINAFCSDGRIYLNDWTEILKPDAQIASGGSKSSLNIASYSANFTKMAFKNIAIYDGKNLSKDDCIKAYNYLQTLKSK